MGPGRNSPLVRFVGILGCFHNLWEASRGGPRTKLKVSDQGPARPPGEIHWNPKKSLGSYHNLWEASTGGAHDEKLSTRGLHGSPGEICWDPAEF